MVNEIDLQKVHELAEKLTGSKWCPYVSEMFAKVVLSVDDDIAKRLIENRREFSFPNFFVGEPQFVELTDYITELAS